MVKVNVTTRDGENCTIEAKKDQTLMEALRDKDIEGIDAICGGSCACATCHIYVDESWLDKVPQQDESEDELLEDSDVRETNSRLACQIPITDEIDGLSLTIPPEE